MTSYKGCVQRVIGSCIKVRNYFETNKSRVSLITESGYSLKYAKKKKNSPGDKINEKVSSKGVICSSSWNFWNNLKLLKVFNVQKEQIRKVGALPVSTYCCSVGGYKVDDLNPRQNNFQNDLFKSVQHAVYNKELKEAQSGITKNSRGLSQTNFLRKNLFPFITTHQLLHNRQYSESASIEKDDCEEETEVKKPYKKKHSEDEDDYYDGSHDTIKEDSSLSYLPELPKVAIIGAGMAGISAAHRLIQCGIKDVNIFEATNRLGGRINTSKLGKEGTVELGAEWIAGGNVANPVYILASREGLIDEEIDFQDNKNLLCMTSNGGVISSELCALSRRIFNKIRSDAMGLFGLKQETGHGSLSFFIQKRLKEEVSKIPEFYKEKVEKLLHTLVNNIRTRWGAELMKMSSDLYGSYVEVPGNSIRLNKGMVNILIPLLNVIPSKNIHCYSPVDKILWNHLKERVVLISSGGMEEAFDYVIVTVPLGFLKENHKHFFEPELPVSKVTAIENLGFGNIAKVFMKYDGNVWGQRRTVMSTVWNVRDWADRTTVWYKGVSNIELKGDLASCSVAGAEAFMVESSSPEEVAVELTHLLKKFTGSFYLPFPSDIIKSKWNCHPYYLGAVSYLSIYSSREDQTNLAEPLPITSSPQIPKVMFAGEATYPGQFSSAHGARLSGIREADRIISLTKSLQGPPSKPRPLASP